MRLHRFFLSEKVSDSKFKITNERLIHQWRNVFRYNVGSEVILFDGSGMEYDAVIEKMGNREIEVSVVSKREGVIPERKITLCISLIKKDNLEWVVEKATELGVSKIIPIVSERSEKKGFNIERAKKIAIEASEQCGRGDVPEVEEILDLNTALEKSENIVVFDPIGESLKLGAKSLEEATSSQLKPLSLFVGPEGGWSEKELDLFKSKNAKIFSLGKLVLRAETAVVAGLAKFLTP